MLCLVVKVIILFIYIPFFLSVGLTPFCLGMREGMTKRRDKKEETVSSLGAILLKILRALTFICDKASVGVLDIYRGTFKILLVV